LPPAPTDLLADSALPSDRPTQNTRIWMTRAVISIKPTLNWAVSEAVRESCLVDGHFYAVGVSPPQLRDGL
jgi:hypothetical protein